MPRERGRQVVRQWQIMRLLEGARLGLTVEQVCDALEEGASTRTVYRDLHQLEAAGFPLIEAGGRYRLRPDGGAWAVPLDPTQVLAVIVCEELLAPLEGSHLAGPLKDLKAKLLAMLTPVGRDWCAQLRSAVVATTFGPGCYEDHRAILDTLLEAITCQQALLLRHASPGREATERVVEPLATWYASGRVYLIGRCREADGLRTFAVQRIQAATMLDEVFEPDPEFEPAAFVARSFGVYQGPVEHVVIAMAPGVAHIVRERRFHHTQRIFDLPDGGVRLEMDASGLPEIAAWVAGFGGDALPLEPPGLVEAVRRLHQGGLQACRSQIC